MSTARPGSELARIALLSEVLRASAPGVETSIGDDAAVLAPPPGQKLVWTVDAQVEGVHFERRLLSWADVGWRAVMAAASDIAAMGASPWCALAALELPGDVDDEVLEEIARGQAEAAAALGAPIVGGNLARGPVLAITTTFLGTTPAPVHREGARAGDGLYVAGGLGLAAAGFRLLSRGETAPDELAGAWRRPRALVVEGLRLVGVAHAAVDVSDGLARDVGHLVASGGLRGVLDAAALRGRASPALANAADALGVDVLEPMLAGGEDYALVCASPVQVEGFARIGHVEEGAGVVVLDGGRELEAGEGWDHFG